MFSVTSNLHVLRLLLGDYFLPPHISVDYILISLDFHFILFFIFQSNLSSIYHFTLYFQYISGRSFVVGSQGASLGRKPSNDIVLSLSVPVSSFRFFPSLFYCNLLSIWFLFLWDILTFSLFVIHSHDIIRKSHLPFPPFSTSVYVTSERVWVRRRRKRGCRQYRHCHIIRSCSYRNGSYYR